MSLPLCRLLLYPWELHLFLGKDDVKSSYFWFNPPWNSQNFSKGVTRHNSITISFLKSFQVTISSKHFNGFCQPPTAKTYGFKNLTQLAAYWTSNMSWLALIVSLCVAFHFQCCKSAYYNPYQPDSNNDNIQTIVSALFYFFFFMKTSTANFSYIDMQKKVYFPHKKRKLSKLASCLVRTL